MNCLPTFVTRRVLLLATLLVCGPALALSIDLPGPPGSARFGEKVVALPNGNFVVTDPDYGDDNEGAVHLITARGALVSTLTGTTSGDLEFTAITVLPNSNFVVGSPHWDNGPSDQAGAVTYVRASTGINGRISPQNSLVGTRTGDQVGFIVRVLANGHYAVYTPFLDVDVDGSIVGDVGAWTFARGDTGRAGVVSAANSIVGTTANDMSSADLVELSNGHVVLRMPQWDNGTAVDAGAVLWVHGTNGGTGPVGATNALVGTQTSDFVGLSVSATPGGHYIVGSPVWDEGAIANVGAVTWRNGSGPHPGTVTSANSLLGVNPTDVVGRHVVLPNGNVLVLSSNWRHPVTGAAAVGAVTLISSTGPTAGRVTPANSLTGTLPGDNVGEGSATVLGNGHVVVGSPKWNNGAGAATWLDTAAGLPGSAVSEANSLVGTLPGDGVGQQVVALKNGHYVVGCPSCDRGGGIVDAGAATWGNGATGIRGPVTVFNSLAGTSAGDNIGQSVAALPNGHYVVSSPNWNHTAVGAVDAGAATWVDGTSGVPHGEVAPGVPVTASNSLVGTTSADEVGSGYGPQVLANGNYVMLSIDWHLNGVEVGAVTWANGATGRAGPVTTANSLHGSSNGDRVGFCGFLALKNGNYVASSCSWDHRVGQAVFPDVGAVTWGDGSTGVTGAISTANSLVPLGNTGFLTGKLVALRNGDYVVRSDNLDTLVGGVRKTDAGAITLGRAVGGVRGTIEATNSVLGTVSNGGAAMSFDYNDASGQLLVGRPDSNLVTLFDDGLLRDGFE